MQLTIELIGTGSMMQHNIRLRNPLDPYTRKLKQLTKKRNQTDEDLAQIVQIESRGAIYETHDGLVGLPTANVWRSIHEAAKAFKRGKDIERALSFDFEISPLVIGGRTYTADEYLTDPDHIDYRAVAHPSAMRSRPIISDWTSEHHFELATDVLMFEDLEPLVLRAGRLSGVGDARRLGYGRYTARVIAAKAEALAA